MKMKIFEKIEISNDAQKILLSAYKYETKLAISVLAVCMFCTMFILYPFSTIGIMFQLLIFAKYLYDRRIKLKKDIDLFK